VRAAPAAGPVRLLPGNADANVGPMRSWRRDPRESDLGFGTQVATGRGDRLLRPDGSFAVGRRGGGLRALLSLYHTLLTLSWPTFLALVCVAFFGVHVLFGLGYLALGPAALQGPGQGFERGFFFSVHTFSGVGYGHIVPVSRGANLLATVEVLAGLLSLGLIAGLCFARFSRPTADLVFSRNLILAPYPAAASGRALMLRVANQRRNQILELSAKIILSTVERQEGRVRRRFQELTLERRSISLFPLSWTLVHPIEEASPLLNVDQPRLSAVSAEFLVLLTGTDETFSQVVHARTSYRAEDLRCDVRFADAFERDAAGIPVGIDLRRLHALEPVS